MQMKAAGKGWATEAVPGIQSGLVKIDAAIFFRTPNPTKR